MQAKLDYLRAIIREMFPAHRGTVSVQTWQDDDSLNITFYGCKSYAEGSEILRSMGIGVREKSILEENSTHPWVSVTGKIGNHTFSAYCDGLPPSCRMEKYVEKIPVEKTVTTGDFVEVERQKVVCGNGELVHATPDIPF